MFAGLLELLSTIFSSPVGWEAKTPTRNHSARKKKATALKNADR